MNIRTLSLNSASLLMAFSILLAAPAAHAAGNSAQPATAPPTLSTRSASDAVIVKIGTATLEEYQHGNPAERTIIVRDGVVAQNAAAPREKQGG